LLVLRNGSEALKKLAESAKTQSGPIGHQRFTTANFGRFQFFHTFSVTADYNVIGVRTSSGAASTGCCDASDSIGARSRSDIAAPEDGRTPPRRSPAVADPVRFCAELHSIGDFEL